MYSNTHLASLSLGRHMLVSDLIPSLVIATTSPGSTSRTNSAPMVSKAHVSEARI